MTLTPGLLLLLLLLLLCTTWLLELHRSWRRGNMWRTATTNGGSCWRGWRCCCCSWCYSLVRQLLLLLLLLLDICLLLLLRWLLHICQWLLLLLLLELQLRLTKEVAVVRQLLCCRCSSSSITIGVSSTDSKFCPRSSSLLLWLNHRLRQSLLLLLLLLNHIILQAYVAISMLL
jgi:hypothetical protein